MSAEATVSKQQSHCQERKFDRSDSNFQELNPTTIINVQLARRSTYAAYSGSYLISRSFGRFP